MSRPTASQLYNAGVAMSLAVGTPEHAARSSAFMQLFERARAWTAAAVVARLLVFRFSPARREMRAAR